MLKLPQLPLSPKAWRAELFLFSSLSWKEEENVEVDECDEEKDELEGKGSKRRRGGVFFMQDSFKVALSLLMCLVCTVAKAALKVTSLCLFKIGI